MKGNKARWWFDDFEDDVQLWIELGNGCEILVTCVNSGRPRIHFHDSSLTWQLLGDDGAETLRAWMTAARPMKVS